MYDRDPLGLYTTYEIVGSKLLPLLPKHLSGGVLEHFDTLSLAVIISKLDLIHNSSKPGPPGCRLIHPNTS